MFVMHILQIVIWAQVLSDDRISKQDIAKNVEMEEKLPTLFYLRSK